MRLSEVFEDLSTRFVLNLPEEERDSPERLFFQLEEAHWFYEDFYRQRFPVLPDLSSFRVFCERFLRSLGPLLGHDVVNGDDDGWLERSLRVFARYKNSVPVRGCVCLNARRDRVLMCQPWDLDSFTFPKGKINKDESDVECAIREVLEETGVDVTPYVLPAEKDTLHASFGSQSIKLFLAVGVPEDAVLAPRVRKEIQSVQWLPVRAVVAAAYGHPATTADDGDAPRSVISLGTKASRLVKLLERWLAAQPPVVVDEPLPTAARRASGGSRRSNRKRSQALVDPSAALTPVVVAAPATPKREQQQQQQQPQSSAGKRRQDKATSSSFSSSSSSAGATALAPVTTAHSAATAAATSTASTSPASSASSASPPPPATKARTLNNRRRSPQQSPSQSQSPSQPQKQKQYQLLKRHVADNAVHASSLPSLVVLERFPAVSSTSSPAPIPAARIASSSPSASSTPTTAIAAGSSSSSSTSTSSLLSVLFSDGDTRATSAAAVSVPSATTTTTTTTTTASMMRSCGSAPSLLHPSLLSAAMLSGAAFSSADLSSYFTDVNGAVVFAAAAAAAAAPAPAAGSLPPPPPSSSSASSLCGSDAGADDELFGNFRFDTDEIMQVLQSTPVTAAS